MWRFEDKKEGIEIVGTRADIVKALNIHTVYFEDRDEEELVDFVISSRIVHSLKSMYLPKI